jgi:hypothetical protein
MEPRLSLRLAQKHGIPWLYDARAVGVMLYVVAGTDFSHIC